MMPSDDLDGALPPASAVVRTAKGFTYGTHRSCAPAETWERITPHFAQAGLTRVADVTGLDRTGVPVTLAYRPDSPTMASSTGKGLTLEAALVSGAMEAMELYHAEHVEVPVVRASYEDMARRGGVPLLDELPFARYSLFTSRHPEQWVLGRDLLGGGEVAVPYSLVAMWDASFERPSNLQSFQAGSNGLASGNELSEAVVSALLELIERDAVTTHTLVRNRTGQPPPSIRLDTIKSPLVCGLIEQLRRAGLTPALHDCRVDTEVAVYLCHLYDETHREVGVCMGYGAHLDPEIAMLRALTEAVQSRVVIIAGSRDDLFRRGFGQIKMSAHRAFGNAVINPPATLDAGELSSEATDTFEGDIDVLLAKLRCAGLQQVVILDLSRLEFPFAVVRAIVPGLEGYMFDHYTPGRRALAWLRRHTMEEACR